MKQQSFLKTHWKYRYCHGGVLRKSSKGRSARPLSTRDPLHLVFKINQGAVKGGLRNPRSFALLKFLLTKYSRRFFIRVEQFSIQTDHIHLLVRGRKRVHLQSFFKVLAGQFSQVLTGTLHSKHEGLRIWKYRPFTRVIKGYKPYLMVKNYIQLNEQEALGKRAYAKTRLRGLKDTNLEELWI